MGSESCLGSCVAGLSRRPGNPAGGAPHWAPSGAIARTRSPCTATTEASGASACAVNEAGSHFGRPPLGVRGHMACRQSCHP